MAPPSSQGYRSTLCARGSPGRSERTNSESAKSVLAAGGIYLPKPSPHHFLTQEFDSEMRSYCRKQRDGDGGAGMWILMNLILRFAVGLVLVGHRKAIKEKISPNWCFRMLDHLYPPNLSFAGFLHHMPATRAWQNEAYPTLCPPGTQSL